jgi:hypothetical protein
MKNENIQENAHESVTARDQSTENDPLSKPRIQPAKKYAITAIYPHQVGQTHAEMPSVRL